MLRHWIHGDAISITFGRACVCVALLCASSCIACSGETSNGTGGTGGQAQGGGQSQGGQSHTGGSTGAAGSTGQDLGTPLLEVPARVAYDCSVTRDVQLLGISPWSGGVLVAGDNHALLLLAESADFLDGSAVGATLVASGIDAQGVRSEPTNVTEFVPGWISGLSATTVDGTTTAVWIQQALGTDEQTFWLAKVSSDGHVLSTPTRLGDIVGPFAYAYLAPASAGNLLLFDSYKLDSNYVRVHKAMLTLLDGAGVPTGEPKVLLTEATAAGVVRTSQGFLAAYSTQSSPGSSETFLVPLDEAGSPAGPAVSLGVASSRVEFTVRGSEIWAALTEVEGNYVDQNVAGTLRIGRFDANGNRLHADVRLQRPTEDYSVSEPYWIDFGSDVGLLWSKGSITYACAGCIPDDHLEFVILDGTDLTPKSSLLTMTNRASTGGLLGASAARQGDDLLVVSSATYHVSAEGASATIHCTPKT